MALYTKKIIHQLNKLLRNYLEKFVELTVERCVINLIFIVCRCYNNNNDDVAAWHTGHSKVVKERAEGKRKILFKKIQRFTPLYRIFIDGYRICVIQNNWGTLVSKKKRREFLSSMSIRLCLLLWGRISCHFKRTKNPRHEKEWIEIIREFFSCIIFEVVCKKLLTIIMHQFFP